MTQRPTMTATLTVVRIEAEVAETYGAGYRIGAVTATAEGNGLSCSWRLGPDERVWFGDPITVSLDTGERVKP